MTAVISPSLPVAIGIDLLIALEARGIVVRVDEATFELVVTPAHLVSESETETIKQNYEGVMLAAMIDTDAGVRARLRAFAARPYSNLLIPWVPYVAGFCFSCGIESPPINRRPTRCWRCRAAFIAVAQNS